MISGESRRGRRIVGRLGRGELLPEALLTVCRERGVRAAEVRAIGSLEMVEVRAFDQARKGWKPSRTFSGGFEVVTFLGNLSEKDGALFLHAHVAFMRDRDNGVEILGGHLVTARVFALEFVIEAFDDVILRRGQDAATGLPLWSEAIPLGEAPLADKPVTWQEVAAAPPPPLPEAEAEPEEVMVETLGPGDLLIHPTFGRCEVERIEGGYEFAHVRLRNGRLVRLSLDVIKVYPEGREGDRRVFRARVAG